MLRHELEEMVAKHAVEAAAQEAVQLLSQDLADAVEMGGYRALLRGEDLAELLLQLQAFRHVGLDPSIHHAILQLQRHQLHRVLDQHAEERLRVHRLLLEELEAMLGIAAPEVIQQPGLGIAEHAAPGIEGHAMAFRRVVQLHGRLLVLDRLRLHLIEIQEPLLLQLLPLVPRLVPMEEVDILQMADHGTGGLPLQRHRHDDAGPLLVLPHVDHGEWP